MQKQGVLFPDLEVSPNRQAKRSNLQPPSCAPVLQRGKGWFGREARDFFPDGGTLGFAPLQSLAMLYTLCDFLDDAMLEPLGIEPLAVGGCNIWVFGLVGFRISTEINVIAYLKADGERITELNDDFNLTNPFDSLTPYKMMVEHVFPALVPDTGFNCSDENLSCLQGWLARCMQTLLLRDQQFRRLIRNDLRRAMLLPPELQRLCLAIRPRPYRNSLSAHKVRQVIASQDALSRVHFESPHLLRLMGAFIETEDFTAGIRDPVQSLKDALLARAVRPATWRYLVKHGDRILKLPWRLALEQPAFEVAVNYLLAMQAADLPPPPPTALLKAWLQTFNVCTPFTESITLFDDFHKGMNPGVLALAFEEAHRRRNDPPAQLSDFIVEFLGVCWWCKRDGKALDKNQIHAGWRSLIQHWKADEAIEALMASTSKLSWNVRIKQCSIGPWQVMPINNSQELVKASLVMRNCLKDYLVQCATGAKEFCLVQRDSHRPSKYCLGFSINPEGRLELIDVKGFANAVATPEVFQLALEIQAQINLAS